MTTAPPLRPLPARADDLTAALAAVDGLWSLPSTFEATKVHHGYRRVVVTHAGVPHVPALAELLEPFAPVREAWLSWIDPGGFIVRHRDAGPYFERWQLPFTADGSLNGVRPSPGVAFRVHQFDWHEVRNDGPGPRVSLVIDRDVPLSVASQPFALFEEV
jgi:hypothetical protein